VVTCENKRSAFANARLTDGMPLIAENRDGSWSKSPHEDFSDFFSDRYRIPDSVRVQYSKLESATYFA